MDPSNNIFLFFQSNFNGVFFPLEIPYKIHTFKQIQPSDWRPLQYNNNFQ